METKIIEAQKVVFKSLKTTLTTIGAQSGPIAHALMNEFQKTGVNPAGPMEYIYYGTTGEMDKEFGLDIVIPFSEEIDSSILETKNISDFKCTSHMHTGSLENLSEVYSNLFIEIEKEKAIPTQEIREVYHVWGGPTSSKNRVEIQIGLK